MSVKKVLLFLLNFILHLIAFVVITYSLWPLIDWYTNHRPILGVDFFNTASLARFLSNNFTLLPNGFLDMWYAGSPVFPYAVMYWFYPIALVAKVFPLVEAIKMSMSTIVILIAVFTYLAAYRLSHNHLLSILIGVLVGFSANIYGSLAWGGSLPYFANQIFFPLTLFLIASYLLSGNKRWFWASIITSGLAMFGHYGLAGAFILPAGVILLLFGERHQSLTIWKRFKETFVYLTLTNVLAFKFAGQNAVLEVIQSVFAQFFSRVNTTIVPKTPTVAVDSTPIADGAADIAAFYKNQVWTLYTDTHQFLFFILASSAIFFAVTLLFFPERRKRLGSLAWLLVAVYSFLHVYLNANGISFIAQGWYRAFWHFPILVGLAAAAFIGSGQNAIFNRFKFTKLPFYALISLVSVFGLVTVFMRGDINGAISLIDARSSPASAHPEAINLVRNQKELDSLKEKLLPPWLPGDDRNYRMFTSDAQVNVWWNALFDLPLVRGYLDAPGDAGYHFLLDQAAGGDDLVNNFDYSTEASKNMALYYLDWYAVKYGEGGHLSKSPNKSYSTYLEDLIDKKEQVGVEGAYLLYETDSGKPEIKDDVIQYLNFYKFKDEIVSPIALVSNSPTLLCICDRSTHESLNKILGLNNINSRFLINIYADSPVDSFSISDLLQFDMVLMANYDYRNKSRAFKLLQDYLNQGGKIFIDTGGETPESQSQNLPDLFPFSQLSRKGLGKEWDISLNQDHLITADLDWNEFSPPLYEKVEWNFSYPEGNVEDQAEVLVSQAGKPILVSKKSGEGVVIWSGMNLAYHVQFYTNVAESKLFVKLLSSLVDIKSHEYIDGSIQYKNSGNFTFTSPKSGTGVLVKSQRWKNWQVTVNGKKTESYAAGPSFPGFMYVPLKGSQKVNVHFLYLGYPEWWMWTFISVITGAILIDLSIFNGILIVRHVSVFSKKGKKHMFGWWEKEEE